MKKLIFTFLISLLFTGMMSAKVVFDPAKYTPVESLGQSLDTIDGVVYLRVILNGWNSTIDIPEVTIGSCDKARSILKFSIADTSIAAGYTLAKINAAVQLMDTINTIPNPWGEGMVPSSLAMAQSPATGAFGEVSGTLPAAMKVINKLQFFGQQTVSWGATKADTIWVGKVTINSSKVALDPNYMDSEELPDGMSVVTIGGKKYLQVILNGWNSNLFVTPIPIKEGQKAVCDFKYSIGAASAAAGLTLAKINGVVQLMDTVNRVQNPWGEGMVPSSFTLSQSPVTGGFSTVSASMNKSMKLVNQVQFFGQETVSWGSTIGDTIWVGKVKIYTEVPNVVFDPATFDPEDLPAGMSIVDIAGVKYLQAILNGWNSSLPVNPLSITKASTHFTCKAKYAVGSSGFAIDKINTFLKLANSDFSTEIGATGVKSTANFTRQRVSIANAATVGNLQIAGQETTGWSAVVGDTLWIGKVMTITAEPNVVFDPAQYDVTDLPTGMSIVDIDGTKYLKALLNGWNSAIPVYPLTTPAGAKFFTCKVKYEVKGSGFELAKINTFLKLANSDYSVEIGASGAASSADFIDYKVNIANAGTIANFQFAGQETTGWSAVVGDYLYIGKVSLGLAAPITFIVDDSNLKTSTGFGIKGSWKTATGEYDNMWNDGAEHAKFYDDGTHGDATAGDHIWTVKLNMIVDNGLNSWEWGVNNSKGSWLYGNFKFTVPDAKAQTLTHENTVSVNTAGALGFKVYPNPASNMIYIMGSDVKSVEIYNIIGSKVLVSNDSQIDISSLVKGTYITKVFGINGEVSICKFNIQ